MRVLPRKAAAIAILGAAMTFAGGTGAAAVSASPAPASPWNETNANAAQSRANLLETTLTRATIRRVRHLRSIVAPKNAPVGGPCTPDSIVTPALTGGSVYAVANGRLFRYDAATGAVIWRRLPNTSVIFAALSVAHGLVVLGERDCGSVSDPNGYLQAFSVATGAPVWSKPISPLGGSLEQMVTSGGYVVAAGSSPGGGEILSVRRLATGALVWQRGAQDCVPSALAVVRGLVVTYRCNNQNLSYSLTASRLATGTRVWSRPGTWQLWRGDLSGPAGHHVYATDPSGAVLSLNPATGKTQYKLRGATAVLAVDGAMAYAGCSRGVCGYDAATGRLRWSARPGSAPALAAEAGGILYTDSGLALNTATGKLVRALWTGQASALAVGDGRIAVVVRPRVLGLYGLPGS